jgi:hypothetical protein
MLIDFELRPSRRESRQSHARAGVQLLIRVHGDARYPVSGTTLWRESTL